MRVPSPAPLGALPLPLWGEGWGEGVTELSREVKPSPHPSPSRSRIYPTSADLKCRTRVNPSSVGEGADRVRRANSDSSQTRIGPGHSHLAARLCLRLR